MCRGLAGLQASKFTFAISRGRCMASCWSSGCAGTPLSAMGFGGDVCSQMLGSVVLVGPFHFRVLRDSERKLPPLRLLTFWMAVGKKALLGLFCISKSGIVVLCVAQSSKS